MLGDITKDLVIASVRRNYDLLAYNYEKELTKNIEECLNHSGIMYRIFSRKKSLDSIIKKMEIKAEQKYIPECKKMQDLIGIRIVLYFADDIDICLQALQDMFIVVDREYDKLDSETFKPQRINYVFRIPDELGGIPEELQSACLIDNTFEVQVRTVFSEGWHEVDHDIRYKFKSDWDDVADLSREMNGILAALEVCGIDMISVCERIAYKKYKAKDWEPMIRNHFRLKFLSQHLSEEIVSLFNIYNELPKRIYRYEREEMVKLFRKTRLPKTFDNVVYLINEDMLHNENITELTPEVVKTKYHQTI